MTLLVWRHTNPSVDSSGSHAMTLYQSVKIRRLFKNGEMQGSEKIQAARCIQA